MLKHVVLTDGTPASEIWATPAPPRAGDPVRDMVVGGTAGDLLAWEAGAAAVWLEVGESAQPGAEETAGAVDAHRYLLDGVPSPVFSAGHDHQRAAQHVTEQAAVATASILTPREQLRALRPALSRLGIHPRLGDSGRGLRPPSRGSGLHRHVGHLVRAHQSAAAEHLASMAIQLRHINVSAHDEPGGVGQEEPACPLAAVPFPVHVPGRISWLQRELNGGGAFVIGNLGHVAGPAMGSAKIMVYGLGSGVDQDTMWLADALRPWRFEVGEVVLLRGFKHMGNSGIFEVVAKPARNVLQLGEILPSVVQFGRPAWLTAERNAEGARLVGCYGEVVGPSLVASATSRSPNTTTRPALSVHPGTQGRSPAVCASSHALRMGRLQAGELVRLQGFLQEGNAGLFRITRVIDRCVEFEEARPCEAGRLGWLRAEANMQGAQVIGEHGASSLPSRPGAPLQVRGIESALAAASKDAGVLPRRTRLPPRTASDYRGPDSLRIHPGLGTACSLFPEGSVVYLRGFQAAGNVGRFVVARCLANSTLVLREPEAHNQLCPALPHPVASASVLYRLADGLGEGRSAGLKAEAEGSIRPQAPQAPESAAAGYVAPITDVGHALQSAEGVRLGTRLPPPRVAPAAPRPPPSRRCPLNCSEPRGVCNNQTGKCDCEPTWVGRGCERPSIPCAFGCTSHGQCDSGTGRCQCDPTWRGPACDRRDIPCPMDCSGHGRCSHAEGKCSCDPSWAGVGCQSRVLPCPRNCSAPNGRCDYARGKCVCEPTWSGVACATVSIPCAHDCSGHGQCMGENGQCQCNIGWFGIGCDLQDLGCPRNCTDEHHGVCNPETRECECRPAWTGVACSVPRCGEHGAMREDGSCECDVGWFSPLPNSVCALEPELCQCSKQCVADGTPSDTCAGRGQGCTETGECQCRAGWSGKGCEIPLIVTGELNQGHTPTDSTRDQFPDPAVLRCCSAFTHVMRCRDEVQLRSVITQDDVLCILEAHGRPKDSPTEQKAMVTELLRGDSDGSGAIDYSEFSRICASEELPFMARVVSWAFAELDGDSDGVVTAEDMVQAFRHRDALAPVTIHGAPGGATDGDAKAPVPRSAAEREALSEEQEAEAERLLGMCDTAEDGVCTIREYTQMVEDTCPECLCATCPLSLQPNPGDIVSECCGAFRKGGEGDEEVGSSQSGAAGGDSDHPQPSEMEQQEEAEALAKEKSEEELEELETHVRARREQEELKKAEQTSEERQRRSEEEGEKQAHFGVNILAPAHEERLDSEKAEKRRRREEEAGKSDDLEAERVLRRSEDRQIRELEEEMKQSSPLEACVDRCKGSCLANCTFQCSADRTDGEDVTPWGGEHHPSSSPPQCIRFADRDKCKKAASPTDCWGEAADERVQELAECMGISNSDPEVLGRHVLQRWKVRDARRGGVGREQFAHPLPALCRPCTAQRMPRPIECVKCREQEHTSGPCSAISAPLNCPNAKSILECWPAESTTWRSRLARCFGFSNTPSAQVDRSILKLWKVRCCARRLRGLWGNDQIECAQELPRPIQCKNCETQTRHVSTAERLPTTCTKFAALPSYKGGGFFSRRRWLKDLGACFGVSHPLLPRNAAKIIDLWEVRETPMGMLQAAAVLY